MQAELRCPNCGERLDGPGQPCGNCGSAAGEACVAAWLSEPGESPSAKGQAEAERLCPGCGYLGPMIVGEDEAVCPACFVILPKIAAAGQREPAPWQITRCPACRLALAVTEADRDRTIVCPRCKYFLGCLLRGDRRHRSARR